MRIVIAPPGLIEASFIVGSVAYCGMRLALAYVQHFDRKDAVWRVIRVRATSGRPSLT